MELLAINWSSVGLKVAQLLLSLSILVILHEFGHYITAKWFKCRVEKFYLFFDPWFSIFKKKVGDTEYGIGWLPLGGYVKISGMVDESMDKEQMKQPAQPWEFRSKPAWQRLIIMLGGVTVNVLLAFVIYAGVLFVWGQDKTPNSSLKNGVWVADSLMNKIGMQNGDNIISVNGKNINYFDDVAKKILLSGGGTVTINRAGKNEQIVIPDSLIGMLTEMKKVKAQLFEPRMPALVGQFRGNDTLAAFKAGIRDWDKIVKVDSLPVVFLDEMANYFSTKLKQNVAVTVNRNDSLIVYNVKVNEEGKIGIPRLSGKEMDSLGIIKIEHTDYSFFAAFPAGIKLAFSSLADYYQQFKLMLTPSTGTYKAMGGFKGMGNAFNGNEWDWRGFWLITAFFSIALAFMNLLPIPALDGGHVVFTLYEMITGRKPNEKFLEYAQIAGMIILLALMIFANGNDWFGWGKGK
jgi:regulator of sigma E protease